MMSTSRRVGDLFYEMNFSTRKLRSYHPGNSSYESISDTFELLPEKIPNDYFGSKLYVEELGKQLNIPTIARVEINLAEQSVNHQTHYEYFLSKNTSEISSLLNALSEQGVFILQIEGVNPFEKDALRSLIEYSSKHEFFFEIHGSLFELPEWLFQLSLEQKKNIIIFTSIYSSNKIINDLLTGENDSLSRVLNNARKLVKEGYKIVIQTPLSKINFQERHVLVEKILEIGAIHQYTWPSDQDSLPRIIDDINIDLTEEEFLLVSKESPEFFDLQEIYFEHDLEGKPPAISITASGKIYDNRISGNSIGSLAKDNLVSIYKQKAIIDKLAAKKINAYYPKIVNYRYLVRSRMFDKEIIEKIMTIIE